MFHHHSDEGIAVAEMIWFLWELNNFRKSAIMYKLNLRFVINTSMRPELHKTALSSADAGLTRTIESTVLMSKFSKEIERTSPSGRGYIYTDTMV